MIPINCTAEKSYEVPNEGSTAGKLGFRAGSRLFGGLLPEINEGLIQYRLAYPSERFWAFDWRLLWMSRQFAPNWTVCRPFVQETSSIKLCTGTFVRMVGVNPTTSSKPRRRLNG